MRVGSRRIDAPSPDAPVTMLELFFDLVFVFVVTQLAGLVESSDGWLGYARAALVLLVTWWIYDGFVWLSNNVTPSTTATRVPMLLAMACFLAMASSVPGVFGDNAWIFAVAYLIVVTIHAIQFSRSSLRLSARGIRRIAPVNFSVAVLLLVAAALGRSWGWIAWVVALVVLIIAGLRRFGLFTLRADHFAERHRLLIIIALGETVVAVGISAERHLTRPTVLASFLLAMIIITTLWWTYFGMGDDERGLQAVKLAAPEHQTSLAGRAYSRWHVLHIAGLILVAVAFSQILDDPARALPSSVAFAFGAGTAAFVLAQTLFRHTLHLGTSRIHILVLLILVALVPVGIFASGLDQLASTAAALVLFVFLAQRSASRTRPRVQQ